MSVEVRLEEHVVDKKTPVGTVKRSLNQHRVYVLNDETGKFTHCGYVGVHAFLPLAGFPKELLEEVTEQCRQQLGRETLAAGRPPLSYHEIQAALEAADPQSEEDEFDDE